MKTDELFDDRSERVDRLLAELARLDGAKLRAAYAGHLASPDGRRRPQTRSYLARVEAVAHVRALVPVLEVAVLQLLHVQDALGDEVGVLGDE